MPLYVDLDHTLVKTDLLVEALWKLIVRYPITALILLCQHFRNPAGLKTLIARKVQISAASLPYNQAVLDYIADVRANGDRRVYLATASHWRYAQQVSAHLGLFDGVLATTNRCNLKGMTKASRIKAHAVGGKFAYMGDNQADIPIWQEASQALVVGASQRTLSMLKSKNMDYVEVQPSANQLTALVRAARPHQWAKNVLMFVPLLTAHLYFDLASIANIVIAFACFSLCASGGYLLNDLVDIESDRKHDTKRHRPLASGALKVEVGVFGAVLLPLLGLAIAAVFLSLAFLLCLLVYLALTNAYSFYLKRKATIDVVTLAVLYTIRVVAGAFAIEVAMSAWLSAFSVFLFVSLAYLKRYNEVGFRSAEQGASVPGRGYAAIDSETTFGLGVSNSTASILVMALYISSPEVADAYLTPEYLWGICLLLLYWTNRIWIKARRHEINDDPVVFATKDRISYLTGLLFLACLLAAKYLPGMG